MIDPKVDLEIHIETNKSKEEFPKPVEFEEYDEVEFTGPDSAGRNLSMVSDGNPYREALAGESAEEFKESH